MIIIITIIIMHLAGSPGSYFAYLKDCLEEWSKNKKTRMYTVHGGTKILRLKLQRHEVQKYDSIGSCSFINV